TRVQYHHHKLIPAITAARKAGKLSIQSDQLFSWGRVKKRGAPDDPQRAYYFVNGTNFIGCNGADARSLSRGECETRSQVNQLIDFLKQNAPGFEACFLDRTAMQIGVRETRRIIGDYILTRDDVLQAKHFADGVVNAHNSIDVHDINGKPFKHEFLNKGTYYQIPYRCFLPEGLEGILVAGRCLSADHHALGSARVMIVTMPMGEAVGLAAAMAVREDLGLRDISIEELRLNLELEPVIDEVD
ncbi:MAG: FAD-dependent oxidoreductase, partial [Planctomycetes bacterium]|nr:FAD-dependent oxidoreductase [Planctomycetota bacterium]